MNRFLRQLMPHGLMEARLLYYQLRDLGVPARKATSLSLDRHTKEHLERSNLNLLLGQGLAGLECAVDVGGNTGDWTADLLRFAAPRKLLLIEPNPHLINGLRARFQREASVVIQPFAVGAEDGSVDFHLMGKSDMNSLLKPTLQTAEAYGDAASIKKTIAVPIKRLDSITASLERIDLLKIDVQGYEKNVIAGAPVTLKKTMRLLLEMNFVSHYEGDLTFPELNALMSQQNFHLTNYSAPHRGGGGRVFWADALYVNGQHLPV